MIRVVHVRGPLWGIEGFSRIVIEEAKKTPGMRFDATIRMWVGYADAVHVTAKRAHERGLNIMGSIESPGPTGLLVASKGLRPYQKTGVDFLLAKAGEGCVLADDLGLGKSMQAVTAARAFKQKTVIACPNLLKGVWTDPRDGELAKWWPAALIFIATGLKPKPIPSDVNVAVCHYEILEKWADALVAWGARTLILDEGHFLMGYAAKRTKAAKKLGVACAYRIMLTGTPINSRVKDLWAPVDVVSPGRLGDKFFAFGMRHCEGHEEQIDVHVDGVKVERRVWKFNGTSNVEELHERATYSEKTPWGWMLRRLKSEVSLELPARQRQVIGVDVKREFMQAMGAIRSDAVLRHALDRAADGKFPQVAELAAGHLLAGSRVVVATHRRKIAELIGDTLRSSATGARVEVIHGGMEAEKRRAVVRSKPECLVCTIDSTNAGINLSHWNVGLVAELVWVPSKLVQWEGRFGREVGGAMVLFQYVIATGTADDWVKRVILNKLDTFQAAIGKTDDKLAADLKALSGSSAAERMRELYEKMMAEDAA